MNLDALVQFIRNGLCCIKDLGLFPDSFLHNAKLVNDTLGALPEPLNKTTPLEVVVSVTQFYAFLSVSRGGFKLMTQLGWTKKGRIEKLQRLVKDKKKTLQKTPGTTEASLLAMSVVQESLQDELPNANKTAFVGLAVLSIGICFFWLFANSWHVTETTWIGGLPAVMTALTVMEVALLPLLVYMVSDGIDHIAKASRMKFLAAILARCSKGPTKKVPVAVVNRETYSLVLSWSPFWEGPANAMSDSTLDDMLDKELRAVQKELERWTDHANDKDGTCMADTINEASVRLLGESKRIKSEGYREFLYFLLNAVAFYGYLLGIMVYLFDDDESSFVHTMKFGMSHETADWHGNFAGDLAWTIEPLVIMGSPTLLTFLSKTDTNKSLVDYDDDDNDHDDDDGEKKKNQ